MKGRLKDHAIVLLVVALSGNPVLGLLGKEAVYLAPTGVAILVWLARGTRLGRRDLVVLAAFAGIALWHYWSFGGDVVAPSVSFLSRMMLALLVVRLVPDYHRLYPTVMVWLSIVSFFFYFPVQLGVDLPGFLRATRLPLEFDVHHIGIHNFHNLDVRGRNCSFFHEPGMFAGYLILAILFLVGDKSPRARNQLVVLTLALLTTKSTTGYAALFPALAMHFGLRRAEAGRRVAWVALVVAAVFSAGIGFAAYESLPFMKEKVLIQYNETKYADEGAEITRMGNFLFDLEFIRRRPLLGWSPRHTTRSMVVGDVLEIAMGQGNGLTGFAVRYGLVGLGLALAGAFALFRRLYGHRLLALGAVLVLCIILNGEQFLEGASFLVLLFLPTPLEEPEESFEPGEEHLATMVTS